MKKLFAFHHLLFAALPIFFLFTHNIAEASLVDTGLPLFVSVVFTASLAFLLNLVLKNKNKSAAITTLFLVLFFSYGHIYNLKLNLHFGNFFIGKHRYLIPFFCFVFLVGTCGILLIKNNLNSLSKILNNVSLSLVCISFFTIGFYKISNFHLFSKERMPHNSEYSRTTLDTAEMMEPLPDIYYIILDGYASSSTLNEVYNFNNQEFIDYLSKMGFYVASESHCNYVLTFLSLASSLNMKYFNDLAEKIGTHSANRQPITNLLNNNRVVQFLKSRGYKFVFFASGTGETNHNRNADLNYQCSLVNEFQKTLLQTTILSPIVDYFFVKDDRNRVLCIFSKLSQMHSILGPKFIFAHMICPHPPFIFDEKGGFPRVTSLQMGGWVWKQKKAYLNQLTFVNKQVETLIKGILTNSKVAPIIILQADHGPASLVSSVSTGWQTPTEAMIKERARIFNAYYLPGNPDKVLYENISPVNTFRVIFNLYFKAQYELLDDRCFFSSYETPYKLMDVTHKVTNH